MTEESKPPKKSARLTPREVFISGVVTGVLCIGSAMLAHHIGYPLTELQREALMGGGLMALLGGAAGARYMPTKAES